MVDWGGWPSLQEKGQSTQLSDGGPEAGYAAYLDVKQTSFKVVFVVTVSVHCNALCTFGGEHNL